jgi:hypothetical protein
MQKAKATVLYYIIVSIFLALGLFLLGVGIASISEGVALNNVWYYGDTDPAQGYKGYYFFLGSGSLFSGAMITLFALLGILFRHAAPKTAFLSLCWLFILGLNFMFHITYMSTYSGNSENWQIFWIRWTPLILSFIAFLIGVSTPFLGSSRTFWNVQMTLVLAYIVSEGLAYLTQAIIPGYYPYCQDSEWWYLSFFDIGVLSSFFLAILTLFEIHNEPYL